MQLNSISRSDSQVRGLLRVGQSSAEDASERILNSATRCTIEDGKHKSKEPLWRSAQEDRLRL